MGLGGYLAARSDADAYRAELQREQREIVELPDRETEEVRDIFAAYGLEDEALECATAAVIARPETWLRFMMKEELGLDEPHPGRAVRSGLTIGSAYVVGGFVPLLPYFFPIAVSRALLISAILTLITLTVFGAVKARFTGVDPVRGAIQTAVLGGLAAGVAYAIARSISAVAGI
jgi:vacuolar iron transporter family protein